MSETKIPVELRQAICDNKLIIFVGAGLSYNLVNNNGQSLKGWGNLVKEIIVQLQKKGHHIEFLLPLLDIYEPIEVLHLIEKHPDFSRETIYDITSDFLELDDTKNDYTLHQKLNTLSKKIITTNYDIAFERTIPSLQRNKAYKGRNYKLNKHRNSDTELLFKLHGCLDHLDNMILFPTDYTKFYNPSKKAKNEKYALDVFKNIINNNSVLFIGTGMGDFQINNIFKKIKRIQKDYGKKHFIITNKSLDSSLDFLTPIKKKHTEIADFIDELLIIKKHYDSQEQEEVLELKKQIEEYENRLKELESKTSNATKDELLEEEALKYFTKGLKHQLSGKFKKAVKQYKNGLRLNPNDYKAYNNLGNALSDLAKIEQNKEALYLQAIKKYQKAIKIKSDFYEAYYNLGNTLTYIARIKHGQEKDVFYSQSIENYKKTIEIQPDFPEAYNNLGHALFNFAKIKPIQEKESFYLLAIENYKEAIKIKPDKHNTFFNWGCALADLSGIKSIDKKEKIYLESFEKYQKAIEIKFDFVEAFDNWAIGLVHLASIKQGEEKEALYSLAIDKFKKVIDHNGSPYNLSCLYALRNKKEEALHYLDLTLKNKNSIVNVNIILKDPDWKDYLDDPGFLAIIEKYK